MHPSLARSLFAFAAPLAASLSAQATVSLPRHADVADGQRSFSMPFGQPGFRTQLLVDAAAIAPNGAAITAIRMRADRSAVPNVATSVPNVTVSLSHSTQLVGGMSDVFANNVTEPPVVVFQGTVQLPQQAASTAGPMPWDIVIPLQQPFSFTASSGQLLIDIVGDNAPNAAPVYWLDGMEAGGAATEFGVAGDNPTGDFLYVTVGTGNQFDPRQLSIGRTVQFFSGLLATSPPGVLALGTTPLPAPLDLSAFGAPTNSLYFDPLVLVPHAWVPSFVGFLATVPVTIPNLPSLVDERLFGQSLVLEPTANALGIVLSAALELRIGDPQDVLPVQQLDVDDPFGLQGTLLDVGFPGSPSRGAVALRLEGAFF